MCHLPLPNAVVEEISLDNKKFYPWLLFYGASTTTTLIPSLATVLNAPLGEVGIRGVQLSQAQRLNLLGSYIPFLIIPLVMALDMTIRISKIVGLQTSRESKAANKKE